MRNFIIIAIIVVVSGALAFLILQSLSGKFSATNFFGGSESDKMEDSDMSDSDADDTSNATSTDEMMEEDDTQTILGQSADGHDIIAYHYGEGDKEVLFVGGIHGGYSWNTVLVAYELMDALEADPDFVPEGLKVTVIPVLNPDGLNAVVGTTSRFMAADVTQSGSATIPGRFNGNEVDLNRNFDCDWEAEGTWQSREVSGGGAPFSEPETAAIRDYVNEHELVGAVVWYSAAGGVFTSNCHGEVLTETKAMTNAYAEASGYKAYESFNFYEITGDMVNWFAKLNIPAISVLLTNHTDVEWSENQAGIEATLNYLAQ